MNDTYTAMTTRSITSGLQLSSVMVMVTVSLKKFPGGIGGLPVIVGMRIWKVSFPSCATESPITVTDIVLLEFG